MWTLLLIYFSFWFFFQTFIDVTGLKIWRFIDGTLGARRVPTLNDYKTGKVQLEDGIFTVNTDTSEVYLNIDNNGGDSVQIVNIGNSLIYVVE